MTPSTTLPTRRTAGGPRPRRVLRAAGALIAAPFLVVILAACEPAVATYTVDTLSDGIDVAIGDGVCETAAGTCSLRAAVQEGNTFPDEGLVEVELGVGAHLLTIAGLDEDAAATGDLDMIRPFRFVGTPFSQSASFTAIDKDVLIGDRIFDVRPGGRLILQGIQVQPTGLLGASGAVIRSAGGNVTLERTVLAGSAINGTGQSGAAIYAPGAKVTVMDSSIINATVEGSSAAGGAVVADEAVLVRATFVKATAAQGSAVHLLDPAATSTMEATTFVDNRGAGSVVSSLGAVSARDVTFSINRVNGGAFSVAGGVTIQNSIIADQTTGPDCGTPLTSLGHNLESGTSCGFTGPSDIQGESANFGPQLTGAGPSLFLAPGPGPAIESGAGCAEVDAGMRLRPIDTNGDGTATCERGAAEVAAYHLDLEVTSGIDLVDLDPGDGLCTTVIDECTLRAAIMETNAWGGPDEIRLASGSSALLTIPGAGEDDGATGDLDITDSVVIRATGATLGTVDANDLDRVIDVHAGTVTLQRLHVIDGTESAGAGGGGVRTADGSVTRVDETQIRTNVTTGSGGGILFRGDGTLDSTSLFSNSAATTGGGVQIDASAVTVVNSTVSVNSAPGGGSGIALSGSAPAATIRDATITSGTGSVGILATGSVTARNSIVASHVTGGNCSTSLATLGHNLDSGTSCGFIGVGDVGSLSPLLGIPANNGGPTLTMLPQLASPAKGTGVCVSVDDQRGVARPQGGACDKGAVEIA